MIIKFTSIKRKLIVLSGICLFVIVSGMILSSIISSSNIKQVVNAQTSKLLAESAHQRIIQLARAESNIVIQKLQSAGEVAKALAQQFTFALEKADNHTLKRANTLELVRNVLNNNKEFMGVFTAWEPNAFDGLDDDYIDNIAMASTSDGRFAPYWYMEDHQFKLDRVTSTENTQLMAIGLPKNIYYSCPKSKLADCIIDPQNIELSNKNYLFASMVSPIIHNGKFMGMTGVDYTLSFIQQLAEQISKNIYNGQSEVLVISNFGIVAGSSHAPGLLAKQIVGMKKYSGQFFMDNINQNKVAIGTDSSIDGVNVVVPFTVPGVEKTPWAIVVRVPNSAILSDVYQLNDDVEDIFTDATNTQIIIAFLLGIIALFGIAFIANKIVNPLVAMVNIVKDIAQGEGDLSKRVNTQEHNELGELAYWLNYFIKDLQKVVKNIIELSNDIESSADTSLNISSQINNNVQQQQAQTEQVVTAVEEMSYNALEVAKNTEQAASSASSGNELTDQGIAVVSDVVNSVETLSENTKSTTSVINNLSEDINQINIVLVDIQGIADQTNLLALNAAIEAARAGEQGRGFAVVADEVRNLAQRTRDSVDKTKVMIDKILSGSEQAVSMMSSSAENIESVVSKVNDATISLADINTAINVINNMSQQIATAAEEQHRVSLSLTENVTSIGDNTNAIVSEVDKANQFSTNLEGLAHKLQDITRKFKV